MSESHPMFCRDSFGGSKLSLQPLDSSKSISTGQQYYSFCNGGVCKFGARLNIGPLELGQLVEA